MKKFLFITLLLISSDVFAGLTLRRALNFDSTVNTEFPAGDKPSSPVADCPTGWTCDTKGDATQAIDEVSATSFEMVVSGSNDVENIAYASKTTATDADIQISERIPATWVGHLENFTGFGVGLEDATGYRIQAWNPNISGTVRCKRDVGGATEAEVLGLSNQTRPRDVAIKYDDSLTEISCWESNNGTDWFQVGPTVVKSLTFPVAAYSFGTSHIATATTTAITTNVDHSNTLTIGEGEPPPDPEPPPDGDIATLMVEADLEDGPASIGNPGTQYRMHVSGENNIADVTVVSNAPGCGAPRSGNWMAKAHIFSNNNNNTKRAEIMTIAPGGGNFKFEWDGPEYWIGWSFCVDSWNADAHTFMQIHAPNEQPGDPNYPCDYAGNAQAIFINNTTAQWRVIDNPSGQSDAKGAASNTKAVYSIDLGQASNRDVWHDFVAKFKLSTTGNGYYTVWHNGNQVASETGLVNVNWKDGDKNDPEACGNPIPEAKTHSNGLHLGIYSGQPNLVERIMYFDEARIAEGENGFNVVDPAQND